LDVDHGPIVLIAVGIAMILMPIQVWFTTIKSDTALLTRFYDLVLIVIGTAMATVGSCSLYHSACKNNKKDS